MDHHGPAGSSRSGNTEMQARSQEKPAKRVTSGKCLLHCVLEALETERASQLTSAIPCFFFCPARVTCHDCSEGEDLKEMFFQATIYLQMISPKDQINQVPLPAIGSSKWTLFPLLDTGKEKKQTQICCIFVEIYLNKSIFSQSIGFHENCQTQMIQK